MGSDPSAGGTGIGFPSDDACRQGAEDGYQYFGRLLTIDALQRIYVEEQGEGPVVVFVPGYGGDAAYFVNLADALADSFTTVRYDRRGNSRSPRGWTRVTLDEQADDLARILDRLGHERCAVFASSNGCSVALRFVLRHGARVRAVLLHEPFWSPAFVRDPASMRSEVAFESCVIAIRRDKDCGELEARLRCLAGDRAIEFFTAETRRRLGENTETGAIEREVFSRWVPTLEDWAALANREDRPVSVLVGADTQAFFVDSARFVAAQLGAPTIAVPGGHAGFVDHADAIAAATRPILDRCR